MPKPKLIVQKGDLRKALLTQRLSQTIEERKKAAARELLTSDDKQADKLASIVKATELGYAEELKRLLDLSPDFDINSSVCDGNVTLLHLAARFNQTEVIKFLLSMPHIKIDAQADAGATALFNAAISGSFDSAKILLEAGAKPHIASIKKETPLHIAAANGYTNIAELLIAYGSKINEETITGDTPLHLSRTHGKVFTSKMLLSYKAEQKATNKLGETPLVSALKTTKKLMDDLIGKYSGLIARMSMNGPVPLVVKLPDGKISETDRDLETAFKTPEELLAFIAIPEPGYVDLSSYATPLKAFTSILFAGLKEHSPYLLDAKIRTICLLEMIKYIGFSETIKDHKTQEKQIADWFDIIKFLIMSGEDLTTPDSDENYPITLAADLGFSEIVKMLYDRDVCLDSQDKMGKTPLMKALEKDHNIFKVLSNYSIISRFYVDTESTIDCLIQNCSDLSLRDSRGNTAIFYAAHSDHIKAVSGILEFECDVDSANIEGITPLMATIKKGNKDIVKILLEEGARYDLADVEGVSAIHMAAIIGNNQIINLLLDAGANIDQAVPIKGITALMIAMYTGNHHVAKLLIERGADKFAKDVMFSTIHFACKSGYIDIVAEILKEQPEEINILSSNGNSSLHIAASNGHVELVRFLLTHGADTRIKNGNGKTPLALFNENQNIPHEVKKAVVKLFLCSTKPKIEPERAAAPEEHDDCAGSTAGSAASTISADAPEDNSEFDLPVTGSLAVEV